MKDTPYSKSLLLFFLLLLFHFVCFLTLVCIFFYWYWYFKDKSQCLICYKNLDRSPPEFRDVYMMYCAFTPGTTVKTLCTRQINPHALKIDERYMLNTDEDSPSFFSCFCCCSCFSSLPPTPSLYASSSSSSPPLPPLLDPDQLYGFDRGCKILVTCVFLFDLIRKKFKNGFYLSE